MDKYEYQLKTEHIRQVAARKEYGEAAKLCDTIDWTKIRDVKMLTLAADVYTAVGEYEKAIDILQQAYEYAAMGRRIVYRLTELALKADSYDDAKNYFEEFCRIAPNDQGRYILLYKMARYQKATLDEKIKILEAYKREDFDEKWAYELAVLYAMNNEKDKCIQLCDDIILWFGLGKYVEKALSLKSQFAPLTQAQKEKAQKFADKKAQEENEKLQKKQEEQEKKESQAELAKKAAAQEKISKWQEEQEKAYQAEQEALLEREEKLRKQREEELEAVERLKKAQRLEHARQSVVTSDMNEIMAVIQRAKQEDAQNELQDELAKQVQQVQQLAGEKDLELVSDIHSDVEEEEKLQVPEELSYIQDEISEDETLENETSESEISENKTSDTETANTETVNTETAEKTSDSENADETVWFEAYHPEEEPQISEWAAPVAETVELEPEEEVQEEIQEEPEEEIQEEIQEEPEEGIQEEIQEEPEEEEPQEEFEEEPEEEEPQEEIKEEPEKEPEEAEVQVESEEESEEESQEEIQEEPEEKEPQEEIEEEPEEEESQEEPQEESAESRQVEMTANGGLPIVNPEDMSRVWHFAIQAMPDEDDIELALEYLEELAERSSRAVPRSVVKITGQKLNQKGLVKSIDKLLGKTILIEDAADMNERVINEFCKIIDPTDRSLLVVFIDTPASIRHLLIDYPQLAQVVTAQFVRETYSVTELLEYARGYADREDSVFDKSGELALMERLKVIAGNQERNKKRIVEMIVNNAIEKAEKKSMRKLFQSKYDKRGCLILRDKDFEVG